MTSISDLLCLLFGLSELWLGVTRRSKKSEPSVDRHSLRIIAPTIAVCVSLGVIAHWQFSSWAFPFSAGSRYLGFALFAGGVVLRWWSIFWLGRYFTVNVAIATDHRLIDTGPYKLLRHPSYSGLMLILAGLGILLANWVSLLLLLIPTFTALLYRMRVEEAALLRAFGQSYQDYLRRTKRLIPFVY